MQDIRHLRLNLYLPSTSDKQTWSSTFPSMLKRFAHALDGGSRILELKILISTWHKPLLLRDEHGAAFGVLGEMHVRGSVHVRTQGIFDEAQKAVKALQLQRRMKGGVAEERQRAMEYAGGRYLDWDWEGGGILE